MATTHVCSADCTAGWQPSRKAHCSACGENFSTPGNFDKHRRDGECVTPIKAGLIQNKRGVWTAPGETDFDARFGR